MRCEEVRRPSLRRALPCSHGRGVRGRLRRASEIVSMCELEPGYDFGLFCRIPAHRSRAPKSRRPAVIKCCFAVAARRRLSTSLSIESSTATCGMICIAAAARTGRRTRSLRCSLRRRFDQVGYSMSRRLAHRLWESTERRVVIPIADPPYRRDEEELSDHVSGAELEAGDPAADSFRGLGGGGHSRQPGSVAIWISPAASQRSLTSLVRLLRFVSLIKLVRLMSMHSPSPGLVECTPLRH